MSSQKRFLRSKRDELHLGVAVVIGALLLLGITFVFAAQYQVNVVPQEEERKETQHSKVVQNDMIELRNNILKVSSSGSQETTAVQLGTTFDGGQIVGIIPVINQPSPPGTITATNFSGDEDMQVSVKNASGVGSSSNFWNGEEVDCEDPNSPKATGPTKCYNTSTITYSPEYRHIPEPPTTVYENTIVYDRVEVEGVDDDVRYVYYSDQNLIDGKTINIVTVTGDFKTTSVNSQAVDLQPASAPSNTISVEDSGDPITIKLPTHLPEREWENLLSEETTANGGYIQDIRVEGGEDGSGLEENGTGRYNPIATPTADPYDNVHEGMLVITLKPDTTYAMKMSRVHASTSIQAEDLNEDAEYVGWTGTQNIVIRENSQQVITGQVRDRYNNPVIGATVQAFARDTSSGGECTGDFPNSHNASNNECSTAPVLQPGERTSVEDGQVEFVYESPETNEDKQITISLELQDD